MGWFSSSSDSTSSSSPSVTLIGRAEKFQKDLDKILNEVTQSSLPLQKQAFICSSECFDKHDNNVEAITNCVKQCQNKPEKFGNAVQNELNQLQDVLLNCQQNCFNKYSSSKVGNEDGTRSLEMERCAVKCYDDNQYLLNDISKRLENIYKQY